MRRTLTYFGLLTIGIALCVSSMAQQIITVSGTVKNINSKELISAVSVTVKGGSAGTFTDDKGSFKFSTVHKLPFTLVFSSVGYANKEVTVKTNNQVLNVEIDASYTLGDEVVVAASRVPERILESPVSIERISAAAIRNTPSNNYYDMITNLKGVDAVEASLTFRSMGTRGFNSSGNTRLNQLVDGMDNQAPGLNFSVGNAIGLTELDVDNIELLPGASSALYGSGGMNGTLLINSKNPFKYQGLSFQVKQGVKDIDGSQRPPSPYYDWSFRWGKKVSEKFAFKIGAQFVQAKDWLANQTDDYSRTATASAPNGQIVPGTRTTDPNYDGINVYGDETTSSLSTVASSVFSSISSAIGAPTFNALYAASNSYLTGVPNATLAQYNTFLTGIGGASLVSGGYSPILYGNFKNYFNNTNVSRTGYSEKDVINPITLNVKLTGSVYYKLSDNTEASLMANWGTGNSVYTGSDRYALQGLKMGQYKAEIKSKNWYVRAYTTHENSGNTFDATITTRLFNEAWKPSSTWYPQYMAALTNGLSAGLANIDAQNAARAYADQGRPVGPINNNPIFKQIASTPISKGGGLFLDATRLNVVEGQYNFSNDLGLTKTGTDLLVGASNKQYVLNSQGTLFADTTGPIKINEIGTYAQLSQKLFGDLLKLSVSGRYDKNTNFDGKFTPRASAVVKLAKDQNLRFSYQEAYRFPTTQNQWINLNVGGGTVLLGGLPQLRDFYNFSTNPVYTVASVTAFGASVVAGAPNPGLLQQQTFGKFKPESSQSFEVGYKGLIAQRLLIDVYAYWATYKDFLSSVTVVQDRTPPPGSNPADLLISSKSVVYSVSVNTPGNVNTNGWGASAEYLLPRNYSVSANVYSDMIGTLPVGFTSYFNTGKYRANLALNNSGFGHSNRYGFSVVYRWVDGFLYESSFATGNVPTYSTLDAMVSYKFPKTKSLVKLGATNILNQYYRTAVGNPSIGGLYYVSFGWNVF